VSEGGEKVYFMLDMGCIFCGVAVGLRNDIPTDNSCLTYILRRILYVD
jgi:hypothetical protein